jgi:L-lactate dehydrogenase complex protein LldE
MKPTGARAEALAARTCELSQYLVDALGVEDCGARFEGKIAYHESCHILRGPGVSGQPKKLISKVKGSEPVALTGVDNLLRVRRRIYQRLSRYFRSDGQGEMRKLSGLRRGHFTFVRAACLLNIGGYMSCHYPDNKVMHLVEFLAYGGSTDLRNR